MDIVSIGAGGGSIVWLDREGIRGRPDERRIGSWPGVLRTRRHEPTVTDSMVIMNFLDPDEYLGGRRKLDRAAAGEALTLIGSPHDWTPERTAAAVHDIAVGNMVSALREVSIIRGTIRERLTWSPTAA